MTAYARSAARANSAIHPCSQRTTQYIVNTFSCHRSRVAYARSTARASSAIHPCSQRTTQYVVNTFPCHRSRVAEAQPEQAQQYTPVAKEQHIYHQYLACSIRQKRCQGKLSNTPLQPKNKTRYHQYFPCHRSCHWLHTQLSLPEQSQQYTPVATEHHALALQHCAQATYSTVTQATYHAQIKYSTVLKSHTAHCSNHIQHHAEVTYSTVLKSHLAPPAGHILEWHN